MTHEINPSGERKSDKWRPSALNSKYRHMSGEFNYKGHHFVRYTSPERIKAVEEKFEFLSTDIILAGYAKSGNTLLAEIVRLLAMCQGDANNISKTLEVANRVQVHQQVLFLEETLALDYPFMTHKICPMEYLEWLKQRGKTRLIKTHLPLDIMKCALKRMHGKDQPLILYVYRNPKDVAVSMYHFYRGITECGPFEGDWEEFFEMWIDGWIFGGDWRKVVPEWLRCARMMSGCDNICVHAVSYEAMVRQPDMVIKSLHALLSPDKTLDRQVLNWVRERVSFENMQRNPMTNYDGVEGFAPTFKFMRKGKVGDWKNWFTVEQNERFTEAYADAIAEINELLSPESLVFE